MTAAPHLPATWNAADHDTARSFATLLFAAAECAYMPPPEGLAAFRSLGLAPQFLSVGSTQAYAADCGPDAIVAFRGTQGVGDILTDLRVIRRHTPGGFVHSGFWDGYDKVHASVADVGSWAARRGGKLWLTGHSLGGALAVVGAYRVREERQIPIGGVITFGQPMVGSPAFAAAVHPWLHDRYLCFINGRDAVPNLVWPYVHFGELVSYRHGAFQSEHALPRIAAAASRDRGAGAGPSPLLAPLDDTDLDDLIRELEAELASAGDPENVRMRGMIPWVADHSLAAYSNLAHAFAQSTTA